MDENSQQGLSGAVRVMQIIVSACTMGLLFFITVVCLMMPGGMRGSLDSMPLLTSIGLGLAVTMIVARWIVLQTMTAGARRQILRGMSAAGSGQSSLDLPELATGQLVAFYQTRMIVGVALLEGASLFLLIAHLIERSPWSLAAAIVMILGVASHFPTQQRVTAWVEQQMALLQEERQVES